MTIREDILNLADKQVGYTEGKDNHNKYAQYFDTPKSKGGPYMWFNGKKQNVAWCSIFVCWLLVMVLEKFLGSPDGVRVWMGCPAPKDNCAAGVPYLWQYLCKRGWKIDKTKGRPADIIFLNGNKHVGIIEYVKDGYYHTIEGNKGNKVARGQYKIGSSYIYGICSPDYESLEDKETVLKPEPVQKPTPAPVVVPTTKKYQVICKKGLNVRTGPGTKYTDVGNLNYGQTVTVYETSNGWAKIDKTKARWACIKRGSSIYMKVV